MATLTATRPGNLAPGRKLRASERKSLSFLTRVSRSLMRRPQRSLAVGLGLALAGAIILNALVFQKARHPAPFLSNSRITESKTPATPDTRAALPGASAPVTVGAPGMEPPARPSNLEALIRETALPKPPANVPGSPVTAARAAPREAAQPRETAPRDPIAELVMGETRPPAPVGQGDSKRITLSAQKALAKLGYGPVKTEGRLDDATRNAIARFEKDRKLPVTRELSPRTQRELAAASGLRIE